MSRGPRRPKPPPSSRSCSLTLSRGDAERLGGRLLRHWSGSGCRPRFRRSRPRPKPMRPRSAAPSAHGRRSRRDIRLPWWTPLSAFQPRASPALNQSRALTLRIARRRDEGVEALVAVEAPGLAGLAPAHAVGDRPPCRERRPGGFGDDADAVRQLDGLDDAGDRLDLGLVESCRAPEPSTGERAARRRRACPAPARRCRTCALPLTLVGSSTRITSLPIRRKSLGFFSSSGLISGALSGTSAKAAISP